MQEKSESSNSKFIYTDENQSKEYLNEINSLKSTIKFNEEVISGQEWQIEFLNNKMNEQKEEFENIVNEYEATIHANSAIYDWRVKDFQKEIGIDFISNWLKTNLL